MTMHCVCNVIYCLSHGAELVVLGTGSTVVRINPDITKFLKRKGISLEVQDTVSEDMLRVVRLSMMHLSCDAV